MQKQLEHEKQEHNLMVCDRCLQAIISREGNQFTKTHYFDEPTHQCEWCLDEDFDTLYEFI